MKQKDYLLVAVVVIVSAVFSILLSKIVITSPKHRQQQVEVVNPITAEFNKPDAKYFNKDAINPTQLIHIGDNSNTNPFNAKQ